MVDVTPIQPSSGTLEHASIAASTVVFAPSMPAEGDCWRQNDAKIITGTAPNSEAGHDKPIDQAEDEQLVDFIPVPKYCVARISRDAASELTVGAQSQLRVDSKEDDFGPVVDQTLTPPSPLR